MMKFLVYAFSILALILAGGCSDSNSTSSSGSSTEPVVSGVETEEVDDMVLVKPNGASVFMGTNDSLAKPNERPMMKVALDYPFYMGKHEVTCGEFSQLTDGKWGKFVECENDSFPVANVTYYDAVLYANALSKKNKLDTVYSYMGLSLGEKGNCESIEGLAFNADADGYRLPTEAEWMFAANLGWKSTDYWYSENSDYEAHEVCSIGIDSHGFCDFAGNVMEWVNDWLGFFKDTTLTNYVGAPDGGALGERILKGGSFMNSSEQVNLFRRGDIYTVSASNKADYVGFRLVKGKIPDALWMKNGGQVSSSPIKIRATQAMLKNKTKTYKMKLAFRNEMTGNLSFVDYFNGSLTVVEIQDTLDVYHPEISPNGEKVAFSTKYEGVSGKSSIYVRNLDNKGSGLVKLNVESAAIPRWRVLENGDTAIVYVTSTSNNKEQSDFESGSTWQVTFSNGKFGTPKKLFDGSYNGGVSLDDKFAVSGARLMRVHVDGRDTLWLDGEQACNVSMNMGKSHRTLLLDFSSKVGEKFVGEKYGVHKRLLIVDDKGNLVQSVAAPDGYTFNHTEWTVGNVTENDGKGGLVVASLANVNDANEKIVLVDLADSSVTDLVEGDDLWHPCFWIHPRSRLSAGSELDLDSAGVYLTENHNTEQSKFRVKMEVFWKNIEQTEILFVGSSRAEMGLSPDLYPDRKMLNVGVMGIDPGRDFYFVKNYVFAHGKNLKVMTLSIDLDGWRGKEDHLQMIYGNPPGFFYDLNHDFWRGGVPDGFVESVENAYPAEEEISKYYSKRGGLEMVTGRWDAEPIEVLNDSVFTDEENQFLEEHLCELSDIIDSAAARNILVVGIIFPQAPQYSETGSFGIYGLQRSVAAKKIEWLQELSKNKPNFILMDENKMGHHDYSDEMAHNADHLCFTGANRLTERLMALLEENGIK